MSPGNRLVDQVLDEDGDEPVRRDPPPNWFFVTGIVILSLAVYFGRCA